MATQYYRCLCPYCEKEIIGSADWKIGRICIMGYCGGCDRYIGEDEANWTEYNINKMGD